MLDAMIPDAPTSLTLERLRAANIHPETRLATDYLNHFNEVVMLLDLVPSMPDCIEDVLAWSPASYEEHFIRSSYRDKDLVLEAFAHAPVGVRRRFLAVIDEMDRVMVDTIAQLSGQGSTPVAGYIAEEAADRMKHLVARAAGLMNAVIEEDVEEMEPASTQDAIDDLMNG